ncbi:MAG TPA: hypothetical protein VMW83_01715 [Spirochaetia bacterium]|nr:hypothetical protein [Spirochaetia bacterium]
MSSAKMSVAGVEYAYIGDQLSFGEKTPDYLCSFYARSFLDVGNPAEEANVRKPEPHGNPSSFPRLPWLQEEVGEPDNGSRINFPKLEY